MYLQELVEVAIGLVFMWFVVSMATMQIQEVIANYLSKRSKDLKAAIEGMLENPEKVRELYEHPLIKGLSKSLSEDEKSELKELQGKDENDLKRGEKRKLKQLVLKLESLPSYIPSKNFSLALFDIVANAGTEKSPILSSLDKLQDGINNITDEELKQQARSAANSIYQLAQAAAKSDAGKEFQEGVRNELKNQIELLGSKHNSLKSLTDSLAQEVANSTLNPALLFKSELFLDQLQTGVVALGHNESLRKSLGSLLAGVGELATETDKALAIGRENVEEWFDNTMDRMNGWYKRWAQKWAFAIGLILAIVLNIDSVNIAVTLWQEPQVRQAYNLYIDDYLQQEAGEKTTDVPAVDSDSTQLPGLDAADLEEIKMDLTNVGLPVGWKENPFTEWFGGGFGIFLGKTLGFLITGLAAMQGAPFWFDILKKLVNVRGSGANPAEKSKEGTSNKEK
jgi:hypothetical protein